MHNRHRILAAMLFAGMMTLVWLLPVGKMLEREYGLPFLYALRGDLPPPSEALVIGLDNESVKWLSSVAERRDKNAPKLDGCLPARAWVDLLGAANINQIPRTVHACLLNELIPRGPRLVVFDVNFNRPRPDDDRLATAIQESGNVLLFERVVDGEEIEIAERREPLGIFKDAALGTMAFHVDGARGQIATGYATRFASFEGLAAMPDLAWAHYTGNQLPVSANLYQPIWMYGPPRTIPTIPLRAVFDPDSPDMLGPDLSDVAVFIGSSEPEDPSIDDHFPVPTSGRGNLLVGGVELAATAFLNRLHGTMLTRPDTALGALIVFAVAFTGGIAALTLTGRRLAGAIVGLSIGYLFVAYLAFAEGRTWLPVFVPIALTALIICIGALAARYYFVRSMVTRLAPRQIANSLLAGTVAQRRTARTEDATIMFTDLVGSTGLAERLSEVEYTEAMNFYYDAATEIIEEHGGLVVEFMGDGIVSMFPESISGPDHAARCCAAARALVGHMNDRTEDGTSDLPVMKLRIGINSGQTATGDIGARERFNFKALGDVVNVAARLEQFGKSIESNGSDVIVISEATRARASLPADDLAPLGSIQVRGRAESFPVFQFLP